MPGSSAVHELDLRVGGLLGLEQLGQAIHTRIGNSHHAHLVTRSPGPGAARALHENLEYRRFSRLLQTQYAYPLHGVTVSMVGRKPSQNGPGVDARSPAGGTCGR